MSELETGADDWRSDENKEKADLRKAGMSLLKTWIPEHPEAAAERDQLFPLLQKSFGTRTHITFLSLLSTGIEDLWAIEYHDQPVSMQELLVQREGTDAFLDPRNALRVVRRKYGMMTLINRITGTFEHRNTLSITLDAKIDQNELLRFCKLMGERINDSAAEEEIKFRKALDRGGFPHVDVIYHSDEIGRRIPVPWEVKLFYARLAREMRRKGADPVISGRDFTRKHAGVIKPKALRQLLLYGKDMKEALEAPPELDVLGIVLAQFEETALLTVTRSLFDEYQLLRKEADHARAMGDLGHSTAAAPTAEETNADFLAEAAEEGDAGEESELLRLARALDAVRTVRGREFFARISMVGGDIDFLQSAQAGAGFQDVERNLAALDPMEGLREARKVAEAFYRARALAAATRTLAQAGRTEEALESAREALAAARACKSSDVGQAYASAIEALLLAKDDEQAPIALQEALALAHGVREVDERAAGLMRTVSTLMEAGPLPSSVRASLSRNVLGEDVHFWGKPEVQPPLVEALVSLLPVDNDTLLFLQKISAHPDPKVRGSLVRTMPFEGEELQRILLAHLKDRDGEVRVEVMERIGWSGDRKLGLYLATHLRQTPVGQLNDAEKRALALNLARLDPDRYLALFNAMLGHLATDDPALTGKFKPLKDDAGLQLAALEVLYHLNGRLPRKILYNATTHAKGEVREIAGRIWGVVKSQPYGDPKLPRSPHDPDWTEADAFDLIQVLDQVAPVHDEPPPEEPEAAEARPARPSTSRFEKKGGLFSRLKARIFGAGDDVTEEAVVDESSAADETPVAAEGEGHAADAVAPSAPLGPPPAALRFDAVLLEGPEIWSGRVPMAFSLYVEEGAGEPVWQELHDAVQVTKGAFEVQLGLNRQLPTPLPNIVWLGIDVDGGGELRPRTRLARARSVVQG